VKVKPESTRRDATLFIPVTRSTRRRIEAVAAARQVPLAAIGREAVTQYLANLPAEQDQQPELEG
jgi:hypothetical protein